MENKLKLWKDGAPWDEAEASWDKEAQEAAKKHPLKIPKHTPKVTSITKETKKNLQWKSIKYMLCHDINGKIRNGFLQHPFRYLYSFVKSLFSKKSFLRDDDFFLYGIKSIAAFKETLKNKNSLLIVGFSYCHKPHECPSGRFTTNCIANPNNLVCKQCFIGKTVNALPNRRVLPLFITTIHYIGEKVFEIAHKNPHKQILFIITACELTLKMFSHWGNMVGIQGIGVRLDGRICNTMRAFEISEKGIKPGLTIVQKHTQKRILDLIRHRKKETN